MRVAIIGGGSWGTTVASIAASNAETKLWSRRAEVAEDINLHHQNQRYLADIKLNLQLRATDNLADALDSAEMAIMAVPSHGFRAILENMVGLVNEATPIISLTKGLEKITHLRMTQIIEDVFPNNPSGLLTGPNLAREVLQGHATASVAASEDLETAEKIQAVLGIPTFRVYTNTDVIGAELGGALKNVIALASGMAEGLGKGDNTRATVITRGLAELTRLGIVMGGSHTTLAGLAGMGDLIVTSISSQSRNRHVGEQLGQGVKLSDIMERMDQVAEGVYTTEVVMDLAKEHNLEMPIVAAVYSVISGESTPEEAYEKLLKREIRPELDY